jgi:hypothetical protein
MKILFLEKKKKGAHLNTVDKFYTYRETMTDNQLNDKHTYNKICDTVLKTECRLTTAFPPQHPTCILSTSRQQAVSSNTTRYISKNDAIVIVVPSFCLYISSYFNIYRYIYIYLSYFLFVSH